MQSNSLFYIQISSEKYLINSLRLHLQGAHIAENVQKSAEYLAKTA